jgi:protoporphyrinogen oxidase
MSARIIVVGGGISGLVAALELLEGDSLEVTLLEGSDQLGGLGASFQYEDLWIDKFYHCIMSTDDYLLNLIEEVGLADELYWKETGMGFIASGVHYPFNTPRDLLKFRAITLFDRFRLGLFSLLFRQLGKGEDLDNVRTETFLARYFGKEIWKRVLGPLFRSKFGDHAGDLPALYLWQRLGRERNVAKRGYLRCGLKGLIDAIQISIQERGGTVRLNTPVKVIRDSESQMEVILQNGEALYADWVISTVPMPLFKLLTKGSSLEGKYKDPGSAVQGVVNALFFLSRPLEGYYWIPVVDSNTTFDGIVEMSALINQVQFGGHYVVYLVKYCDRNSEFFQKDDEHIIRKWTHELLELYQHLPLRKQEIQDVKIFKAPFVEPVYPLGYMAKKPDFQVDGSRLILANTAQVYPNITCFNSSASLAQQAVNYLRAKL